MKKTRIPPMPSDEELAKIFFPQTPEERRDLWRKTVARFKGEALEKVLADHRALSLDRYTKAEQERLARERISAMPEWISVRDAAEILKITSMRVRQLVTDGKLVHKREFNSRLVLRDSVYARKKALESGEIRPGRPVLTWQEQYAKNMDDYIHGRIPRMKGFDD